MTILLKLYMLLARAYTAAGAGDADAADLFAQVPLGMDKLFWSVEAHIQAKE